MAYTTLPCIVHTLIKREIYAWLELRFRGRCGPNLMVVGYTTTWAISAYHLKHCDFESRSWRGVPNTTLCDQVCQ
jgi:hypothetical protein